MLNQGETNASILTKIRHFGTSCVLLTTVFLVYSSVIQSISQMIIIAYSCIFDTDTSLACDNPMTQLFMYQGLDLMGAK